MSHTKIKHCADFFVHGLLWRCTEMSLHMGCYILTSKSKQYAISFSIHYFIHHIHQSVCIPHLCYSISRWVTLTEMKTSHYLDLLFPLRWS